MEARDQLFTFTGLHLVGTLVSKGVYSIVVGLEASCKFAFKEEDFPIEDQNLDQSYELKPLYCLKR